MELAFSKDELIFQEEVREFISKNLPKDISEKVRLGQSVPRDDHLAWQRVLNDKGWAAPNWPVEYGGPGWTPTEKYVFDLTYNEFFVPPTIKMGVDLVGPVIYTFGRADQKDYFIPRILNTEHWWCQGYSEPGAGSDLASLSTKAEREGDHYIVNGSKTWTTFAHWANWIFCLVRTDKDVKQQEGISFLLIDMNSPGIEVQPIITIDSAHHLNMVHFTDVKVPVENRIGEENMGWTYAKFLLGNERMTIAEVGSSKRKLRQLKDIATAEVSDGGALREVSTFAAKIAATEIDLLSLENTNLRYLAQEAEGKPVGPEASMLKVKGSEIRQKLTELQVEAIGYYALATDPARGEEGWNEPPIGPEYGGVPTGDYLFSRAASIYGGSNEIQRGIMAKMVLGL